MNTVDYSVLMSVYYKDDPGYLNDAIESMACQTYQFKQMVIVCDGQLTSDLDHCLQNWQERLGDKLQIVRLDRNVGLGGALAEGMVHCSCDFIARMDADDISRRDRCEKLINKIVADGLDLVGGSIEEFDKSPGDMGVLRRVPLMQDDICVRAKSRNPFNHVTVMFRRGAVERAGGYQLFPWMEDYWLWARMIKNGSRCENLDDVLVDVRVGEGMYARRSNWPYLKSQVRFFNELRKLGIVNIFEQVCSTTVRVISTVLPKNMLKSAYNLFLRDQG